VSGLDDAIKGLEQALDRPRRQQPWRWLVRHRLSSVREALTHEDIRDADAWLAAREGSLTRERETLIARVSHLGPQVLELPDVDPVHRDLKRLVADLAHYRQRVNDLVYDTVALELGGSD
jgi:hypothetical protein